MEDSVSEILIGQFKKLIPLISSLFLILLVYIPLPLPFSKFLRPDTMMISVFFWSLYRQDLFGLLSAVLLGLCADILAAEPIGLNIFICTFILVLTQMYGNYVNTKPFTTTWLGFALIALVAFCLKWGILSVYHSSFLPFSEILTAYSATILFYPLISRFNIFLQNKYLTQNEVIYEQGQ